MSISISEGISISKSIPIITIVRICVSLGLGLRLSHYSGYCESYEKLKNGRADSLVIFVQRYCVWYHHTLTEMTQKLFMASLY